MFISVNIILLHSIGIKLNKYLIFVSEIDLNWPPLCGVAELFILCCDWGLFSPFPGVYEVRYVPGVQATVGMFASA